MKAPPGIITTGGRDDAAATVAESVARRTAKRLDIIDEVGSTPVFATERRPFSFFRITDHRITMSCPDGQRSQQKLAKRRAG